MFYGLNDEIAFITRCSWGDQEHEGIFSSILGRDCDTFVVRPISQLPVANEVRFERPSLSEKKEKKRMNAGREGGDGK